MRKVRVVIIDEHNAVRTALETRLRTATDIEVVAAMRDLGEGRKLAQSKHPDVVLLGLASSNQRELDPTLGLVTWLAQQGVSVLLLAPYVDEVVRQRLLGAGARQYLLKDINSCQLIDAIRSSAAETTA